MLVRHGTDRRILACFGFVVVVVVVDHRCCCRCRRLWNRLSFGDLDLGDILQKVHVLVAAVADRLGTHFQNCRQRLIWVPADPPHQRTHEEKVDPDELSVVVAAAVVPCRVVVVVVVVVACARDAVPVEPAAKILALVVETLVDSYRLVRVCDDLRGQYSVDTARRFVVAVKCYS